MLRSFKAEFFKALAHPVRIRLLDALREGEQTVGDLQMALGVEQSSVSQHLAQLRTQEVVHARRDGTSVWYSVTDEALFDILDLARDIYQRKLSTSRARLRAGS